MAERDRRAGVGDILTSKVADPAAAAAAGVEFFFGTSGEERRIEPSGNTTRAGDGNVGSLYFICWGERMQGAYSLY
jgi:hypothetical protein